MMGFSSTRERGELLLAEVVVQDGETLESALRRFKRKVQQEDIIKEIKRHSFYLKPGEKRRTKEALARKRNRKKRRVEANKPRGAAVVKPGLRCLWPVLDDQCRNVVRLHGSAGELLDSVHDGVV